MTRRELESKMAGLRADLRDVDSGVNSVRLLANYAPGYGLGYKAFATARQIIEAKIAEVEKGLAALPPPSKFQEAKDQFDAKWGDAVAVMGDLGTYVTMLEACRPWVIRHKAIGSLWTCMFQDGFGRPGMFSTKDEACHYFDNVKAGGDWEVVQWEGSK